MNIVEFLWSLGDYVREVPKYLKIFSNHHLVGRLESLTHANIFLIDYGLELVGHTKKK